jgi:hypothetical protein
MSDQKRWAFALTAWAELSGAMSANPGPERLAQYLTDAVKQYRTKPEHALRITRSAKNSRYLKDGVGLHWCGIFAVFCLRKATNDLSYEWDSEKLPRIRRGTAGISATYTKDISRARVGDIGYLNKAQHHFVIIGTEPGRIHSVDGNSTEGSKYNVIKYTIRTTFDAFYNVFGD